jgi:hypothetical protein
MNQGSVYQPRTSVVALEQTHNFAGGTVWPLEQYLAVCDTARAAGVSVYTDGARLLNAVTASGVAAERWCEPVDAVWIDFSKGLGAPAGAAIAGSEEFIASANRFKYLYGGAMRQSGILTAAALYALDNHVERLADDHDNAHRLAEGLTDLGLDVLPVQSNMVFCTPPAGMTTVGFVDALAGEGRAHRRDLRSPRPDGDAPRRQRAGCGRRHRRRRASRRVARQQAATGSRQQAAGSRQQIRAMTWWPEERRSELGTGDLLVLAALRLAGLRCLTVFAFAEPAVGDGVVESLAAELDPLVEDDGTELVLTQYVAEARASRRIRPPACRSPRTSTPARRWCRC